MAEEETLRDYPDVEAEDIRECLRFAAAIALEREIPPASNGARSLIDNALSVRVASILRAMDTTRYTSVISA